MATNVNLLDNLPEVAFVPLAFATSTFEDPIGTARPLWRDYSRWNGQVDFSIAAANGVKGYAARSGISWGYQDPWFPRNWSEGAINGLYRTSYHVIYPSESSLRQADNWYKIHPEIEIIPRVIDLELDCDQSPSRIADATWELSSIVLSRDGVRPIIYSRYLLINDWLATWTTSMLNAHYWWLAQYPWLRTYEHPGPPTLPDRLSRDRVVLHQTCDKKPPFPGEVENLSADWDRWEIGNEQEMHMWIGQEWAGTEPPPEPDPEPEPEPEPEPVNLGKFSNLSAWASFVIAGVPEDRQPTFNQDKLFCHGLRIGNLAFVEFTLEIGEDFGIPNEENNNDRFAFRLTHPDYEIAPIALQLGLAGDLRFEAYFQGGNLEGRYFGNATIKDWGPQGWLISFWLPEIAALKNGRNEKVSREYPHNTNQLWQSSTIKVSGWYEAKALEE